MKAKDFQTLLARAEGETVDFKSEAYDLSDSSGRNDFIKDLLSFANTPRRSTANIVLGVQWKPETGSQVIGMQRQLDDTEFQNALSDGRVQPRPTFRYIPYQYASKQVGVIEIDIGKSGPYTPTRDYPGLQAGAVYYRAGSQNRRAIGEQIGNIADWFSANRTSPEYQPRANSWRDFILSTHGFSTRRSYILIADRVANAAEQSAERLGMLPWRAVIDFDPDSEASGLLAAVRSTIETHRVIHRATLDESTIQPEPGTHWFFARGLAGLQDTIELGPHTAWLRRYKQLLGNQLRALQMALSPTPISVLVFWYNTELRSHLRTALEETIGAFGDLAEIAVLSPYQSELGSICEEADVTFVDISLRSVCAGIPALLDNASDTARDDCVLPMYSGAPITVDERDVLWLSEDVDVLHLGLATSGVDSPDEYRRGATISWRNLQLRHDCDRDLTVEVKTQIDADLRRRQTVRINLYHAPGAGGTTIGRRIAWDFHQQYPTAMLHNCNPQATADRLSKIASLTENSVLLLVDGGEIPEREVDSLYEFAKAQNLPLVILQVLRRFRPQQRTGRRQFWLDSKLSDAEADRFRSVYSSARPAKGRALSRLAGSRNDENRTAFYFGLTAFDSDFLGLERYVEIRMAGLSATQTEILTYIALAHYYGQQSIPMQLFATALGVPRSRAVRLHAMFAEGATPVLELLIDQGGNAVRAAHQWIAFQILRQALTNGPSASGENDIWKQQLSRCARDFASFCRGMDHNASAQSIELVNRVFVYRDNVELLGTERSNQRRFSQLVEDVPSNAGRVDVLRHLTDTFRGEAHFHAHFARLLAFYRDYSQARKEIDFAILMQPDDHVLHHVRGMIVRYEARDAIGERRTLDEIVDLSREAQESFENSRSLSSDLEHGYISEIQMLIGVLDYAGRSSKMGVQRFVSSPESHPFFRLALERVEELVDRVQGLYVGESLSPLIVDCRARLQRLYEDYSLALQGFDNLLARSDVSKPPIRRQIVWTILRRREGNWNNLNARELERIRGLLDANLDERVNDATSLRLWLRSIRRVERPPTIESVIEKVGYWKANTASLDATYYLYVLHALTALDGSRQGLADCERALEECRAVAKFRRDRTRSFEWVGSGNGIAQLVHQSTLGSWQGDFWESTPSLVRLGGRIRSIDAPQKGSIEVEGGLQAFFVPARGDFHKDRDENIGVSFFLGFSYDGPRAWSVSS